MERPPAPPEAVLIELARKAAGLRIADVAARAGLSVTGWSQIEAGGVQRSGEWRPSRGKDSTIAKMAYEVGVAPDRLRDEGHRADAADVLEEILRNEARAGRPSGSEPSGSGTRAPAGADPSLRSVIEAQAEADPDLRPYLMWVLGDVERAAAERGGNFRGEDVFREPHEIAIWNAPAYSPEQKAETIARMRRQVDERARSAGLRGRVRSNIAPDCNLLVTSRLLTGQAPTR